MNLSFLTLVWGMVSVGLLVRGLYLTRIMRKWQDKRKTGKALATVTEKQDLGSGQYRLDYVFLGQNREKLTGSVIALVNINDCNPGTVMEILYQKEKPSDNRPAFTVSGKEGYGKVFLILAGVCFGFTALIGIVSVL